MKIVLVLTAAFFTSAATAAAIPAPAEPVAVPDADKKVCRTVEPALGSNISRRVCKTKAEWAAQRKTSTGDAIDVNKFRDMANQYATPH